MNFKKPALAFKKLSSKLINDEIFLEEEAESTTYQETTEPLYGLESDWETEADQFSSWSSPRGNI